MKYAPQEDPEHQRYMLDTELEMAKMGEAATNGIGYQTEEQWQALHDYLIEHGGLPKAIEDITRVFAPQFTNE
jgi:hypothetical protein